MQKIELEYVLKTNVSVLFTRISTAAGLAEWFAENVNSNGVNYTFEWSGSVERATQVYLLKNEIVRFQWDDRDDIDSYFEFKIVKDDITRDVSLMVIDYVDEDDVQDAEELWNQQISVLKSIIGG